MKNFLIYILVVVVFLVSCRYKIQEAPGDLSRVKKQKSETLIKMNNYVAKRNQELIAQFVKRTGLGMTETGSGLWYGIYERGSGVPVKTGDRVVFTYTLRLLDGTLIDSASATKTKSFVVGKGGVEAGLEEGMLLLHQDDRARLILPPHLAYGNFGDQQGIPSGAFLFYDLQLLAVNP